jgi:hypothetical protein
VATSAALVIHLPTHHFIKRRAADQEEKGTRSTGVAGGSNTWAWCDFRSAPSWPSHAVARNLPAHVAERPEKLHNGGCKPACMGGATMKVITTSIISMSYG